LKQIFDGLNYLHENNIVHQDFKAKNILIDPKTFQIKIIDFGLSKTESNDQIVWSPQGNLKYRPPRIICNKKTQSYCFMDIWCLCLIVLSLLMKIPISSKKVLKLLLKKKTKSLNLSAFAEDQKINEVLTFLKEEVEESEEINKYENPFKLHIGCCR